MGHNHNSNSFESGATRFTSNWSKFSLWIESSSRSPQICVPGRDKKRIFLSCWGTTKKPLDGQWLTSKDLAHQLFNIASIWLKRPNQKCNPQHRLKPIMQETVRVEILKLLDNGIIYLISDSQWVSPVHAVPKMLVLQWWKMRKKN